MKLFIAEKPELARIIAQGLGGGKREDGYIDCGENLVTWAFGHLLELYAPEDYDERYKKWNMADLPLDIKEFAYKPRKDAAAQLKIITQLLKRADTAVHAGDADEEGQILIDEILQHAKFAGPVERLLLLDLTEKGVKNALACMRSNDEFKGISESGFARSQADWIVGMNLTRAYTLAAQAAGGKNVISLGRVQTPILSLVVARDAENAGHKESFYYTLSAEFGDEKIKAMLKTEEKITDEEEAKSISSKLSGAEFTLTAKHENAKQNPPLPYNLLLLQAECANKFNFSPDETLKITQALREKHKLISYNRSDCQYLPENLHEQAPQILRAVAANLPGASELVSNADVSIKAPCFNDANIGAHYGIIPTDNTVASDALSKKEAAVYELIASRFALQFYPPCEFIKTTLSYEKDGYCFIANGRKITSPGFKAANVSDDDNSSDEGEKEGSSGELSAQDLSSMKDAQVSAGDVLIDKKKTKPRPLYTMSTLLKDLTAVSKYVKDEKIKALLREKDKDKKGESGGIGTPATRSEHIKKLFERGFITENKKKIISTELGRALIASAPKILTTPEMTALWFEQQKDIAAGELARAEFLKAISEQVANEVAAAGEGKDFSNLGGAGVDKTYPCKACGKGFMQRREGKNGAFWGCSNYKGGCKKTYNDAKGKPDGYDAAVIKCPKCSTGVLERKKNQKGTYWWGCSAWREGCDARFYDEGGKPKMQ